MSLIAPPFDSDVSRRTLERILDAAGESIAKVGYKRLRMETVARGSGITRQTIYNYFPNKSQLVTAVLLREGSQVNERAKAQLDPSLKNESLLSAAIIELVTAARSSPLFAGLFEEGSVEYVNDLAEHSEVIARMMHDYWGPVLEALAEAGRLRDDVAVDRMEQWLSLFYRSMLSRPALELDNVGDMDRLIRDFVAPGVLVR